jgi:hypothetical protein
MTLAPLRPLMYLNRFVCCFSVPFIIRAMKKWGSEESEFSWFFCFIFRSFHRFFAYCKIANLSYVLSLNKGYDHVSNTNTTNQF